MVIVAMGFLVTAYFVGRDNKPVRILPVYGPAGHTVRNFELIDHHGKPASHATVQGKVYVTDFFFTTCMSICPVMSNQMERVCNKFKGNEEVMLISHTVNPEHDSVPVLAQYAQKHKAPAGQWFFLTGAKQELYDLARKSYFLDAAEGNGGPDDFIHTPDFALIDKEKRIRGYYKGTDSADVDRLIVDIDLLLQEYRYKGE